MSLSLLSLSPSVSQPLVAHIVEEIKAFQGLKALRLEGNTIGVEAAQAIAKALEDKSDFQVHTAHQGWSV